MRTDYHSNGTSTRVNAFAFGGHFGFKYAIPHSNICPPAHNLRAARHAKRRARLPLSAGYTFFEHTAYCILYLLAILYVQVPV